jgi:hypothetical protein
LTYHLLKRVELLSSGPFIRQIVASALDDAESLVNFPHQKEPRIRRDLCTGEINKNGPVEILSYRLFLSFTNSEHRLDLQHD